MKINQNVTKVLYLDQSSKKQTSPSLPTSTTEAPDQDNDLSNNSDWWMHNDIFNQSDLSRETEDGEIITRPNEDEYESYLDFQLISNYSTNIHSMEHNTDLDIVNNIFEREQIQKGTTILINSVFQSEFQETLQIL
jgi:hypothetical protein